MKIKQLRVDNFMKLSAVDLKLEGKDVIITGKNEVGKSSLINALWIVITGKDIPEEPIQQGKDEAKISAVVDRPDGTTLILTRKFKRDGKDTLTVTTEDGADYKSPQAFMNKLFGEISFDPFEFQNMQPRQQKKYLQDVLKINTDDLDARKAGLLATKKKFDDEITAKEQEMKNFPVFPEKLKARDLSEVKELQDNITQHSELIAADKLEAAELMLKIKNDKNSIERAKDEMIRGEARISVLENEIETIKAKNLEHKNNFIVLENGLVEIEQNYDILQKGIEDREKNKPDGKQLETIVKEINDHNENVKIQIQKEIVLTNLLSLKENLEDARTKIKAVEEERVKILTETKMPIEGLDFTEDGISFEGLPFAKGQFSTSKMDEIGMRIHIALQPQLKIARVKDWNMLDTERKNTIIKLAHENGIQLFIESVTDDKEIGFEILEMQQISPEDSKATFVSREEGAKTRKAKKETVK